VAVEAPDTPGLPNWLVTVYLAKGRAALSPGDVAQALHWFDRAHERRPDLPEVAREYALALAYLGGEAAYAAGRWEDALAKFQAVYDADPLYLAWLPERAPRRRAAEVEVAWGQTLLEERALDEAENHCAAAGRLVAELPAATDCLAAVAAARVPRPGSTAVPVASPVRAAPARRAGWGAGYYKRPCAPSEPPCQCISRAVACRSARPRLPAPSA
jgi:tetratricopeptide (TPR) repeat protein